MPTPTAMGVWLKELDEDQGQLTLERAIAKLRDEVTGLAMERHRGNDRALAFCMAKLDEARQWALAYLESQGAIVIVPRAEIMRQVTKDITDV